MLVSDWLKLIAERLSDYQKSHPDALNHRHWSKELLLSFYQSAYATIASSNLEEFGKSKIVKLKTGTLQESTCDIVGQVTQWVTKDGEILGYISPITSRPTFRIGCHVSSRDYKPLESFTVSSKEFEIYPPVPTGCNYYVRLKCVDLSADASGTVPAKYAAMITEWAMYSALSGETDTSIVSLAQLHYKAFFDLLSLQIKATEAFMKKVKDNAA